MMDGGRKGIGQDWRRNHEAGINRHWVGQTAIPGPFKPTISLTPRKREG